MKVVCYVPSFNAGDTTRGVEVARGLARKAASCGRAIDIVFVCPPVGGANFENSIERAGFKIGHTSVPLDQADIDAFMNADRTGEEFVPDFDRARSYIAGYADDIRMRKPDLIINGCIPPAGIAARILDIPTVTYLPFPGHAPWVRRYLLKDVPDELENRLTIRLPQSVRRRLVALAAPLATKKRFFTQPTLTRAGRELGWTEPHPGLFTMLRADVELVTDLPEFYRDQEIGPRARVTGPLYSQPRDTEIDPRILDVFDRSNTDKVFVTMGSSGERRYLLEAIDAVAQSRFNAVVVVQKTICTLREARRQIQIPPNVYLTDRFVPAHQINPLADVAVIHGGQGTVQTAIASGTPFVGVAMQAEQQANLDNFAQRGAGLRIGRKFWGAQAIHEKVAHVLSHPEYRTRAREFARSFSAIDGQAAAGEEIWRLVETLKL